MAVLKYRDPITGERIRIPTTENVALTGPASGDLTGDYPSPQIAPGVITDAEISPTAAIQLAKVAGSDTLMPKAGGAFTGGINFGAVTATGTDLTKHINLWTGNAFGFNVISGFLQLLGNSSVYQFGNTGLLLPALAAASPAGAAIRRDYVDPVVKAPCRVVATTNLSSTGLQTIDGVTLVANDRVLLTAQTTANQNGIWLAASGAWTKASDTNYTGALVVGTKVMVAAGTANANTLWVCTATNAVPWVSGTSTSTWDTYRGPIRTVSTISGATTALAAPRSEYVYVCSAALTLTLPTAVGNTCKYVVKRSGTGTVTIATTASQTIDGAATATIGTQWQFVNIVSDNANWVTV